MRNRTFELTRDETYAMSLQVCVALVVIAVGVLFAVSGQEICHHRCWLDQGVDFVLPEAFESLSGGVPVVVVGLILLAHCRMR